VEEEGQPEGDTENICAVSSSRVSALESERFSEFCVSVPACLPLSGCLECRLCTPVEVHLLSVSMLACCQAQYTPACGCSMA
jgi:hypothetical protein